MHSHIAAYRFVHIRGLWFARPLHAADVGPVVAGAVERDAFCGPDHRPGAVTAPVTVPRAA